jgi:hypothetical protein
VGCGGAAASASQQVCRPVIGGDGGESSVAAAEFLLQSYLQNIPSPFMRTSGSHVDLLLVKVAFLADVTILLSTGKRLLDEAPEAWCNGPCYPRATRTSKLAWLAEVPLLTPCAPALAPQTVASRLWSSLIGHAPP